MDSRTWFDSSAQWLRTLLPAVNGRLDVPALGEWDVRALLGHTCRAFITVERYLSAGADAPPNTQPDLDSAEDYFRAAAASLSDPHRVTQRGNDAGRDLGDDPAASAEAMILRVCSLVARTPDHAIVMTPVGAMQLDAYLPTRAFELTVHGIDLAVVTKQQVPEHLHQNISSAIALSSLIATPEQSLRLLRTITGREELPPDFTII